MSKRRHEREHAEWCAIASEMLAEGKAPSAFDVSEEQRRRMAERGERPMTYDEIVGGLPDDRPHVSALLIAERGTFTTAPEHGSAAIDVKNLLLSLAARVGAHSGDHLRIIVERTTVTPADELLREAAERFTPHNLWHDILRTPEALAHSTETLRRLWKSEGHHALLDPLRKRIEDALREADEIDRAAAAPPEAPEGLAAYLVRDAVERGDLTTVKALRAFGSAVAQAVERHVRGIEGTQAEGAQAEDASPVTVPEPRREP